MRVLVASVMFSLLLLGAAYAQSGGFTVSPIDPADPADPTDPIDPPDPSQGQDQDGSPGGGFGIAVNPEIGLQQTPLPNPDSGLIARGSRQSGFVESSGSGVAMVETRNMRDAQNTQSVAAESAPAATLRALDKTVGTTTDFDMEVGETVVIGRLAIRLNECRYPVANPASDAFAHLQIADLEGRGLFDGWMVASSPALMALEHPRYDVWVLTCSTS
ncbi:MAG: DUF2155 domain-containing protein [Pseudomonadota bacterium]